MTSGAQAPRLPSSPSPVRARHQTSQESIARTLLRLGDWSEIPTLINGLKDERQFTRSLCIQALQGATGETFGFDPKADLTDRVRAIDSWEVWWRARTGEGLLGKNG